MRSKNVADPPILQDWLFNPSNKKKDPANWALDNVLSRAPFMGIDMYQDSSGQDDGRPDPDHLGLPGRPRLPEDDDRHRRDRRNRSLLQHRPRPQWINKSLSWVAANTDKVGVVSYFNSANNSKTGVYWPLDESAAKMAAYRNFLNHTRSATLG